MLTKDTKQELESILNEWLQDERDIAANIVDIFGYIDATPEQIRRYLRSIQNSYTEMAQDAEEEGDPEDVVRFRLMANRVAKLIAKLR